jgi:hypothetical protein
MDIFMQDGVGIYLGGIIKAWFKEIGIELIE